MQATTQICSRLPSGAVLWNCTLRRRKNLASRQPLPFSAVRPTVGCRRPSDSLSAWMIGFTWPVAVGLVMEFYAVLNPAWTPEWNSMSLIQFEIPLVIGDLSNDRQAGAPRRRGNWGQTR